MKKMTGFFLLLASLVVQPAGGLPVGQKPLSGVFEPEMIAVTVLPEEIFVDGYDKTVRFSK